MNVPPVCQQAADEMREAARSAPGEAQTVRVLGPNGRGGVLLAFTVSSSGAERLLLRTEGYSPPRNRTIRRWCTAFWGDFREAEWEIEGNTVQCRPKAAVADTA